MKKNYTLFKTFIIIFLIGFQTTLSAQRDVYLVIGQSNTAGRGDIEAQDLGALSGIDLFNGSTWESAENTTEGFNRYSTIKKTTAQGLNYAYTFSKTLNEITGNQIGLVVNARGGTSIDTWAKGATEDYYGEAITQINAALALGGSTLTGILWHQGESSRNDAAYLSKITNLIANLRTDLGIPNLPVIVGELSKQRTDNGTFNTNIKKLSDSGDAAYVANTDYVSSDGLQTTDLTHFNSNAQRVLGYRYAAKALKMIYAYTYVENQIIYIDEDAYIRGGSNANIAQHPLEDDLIRVKESSNADFSRRGLLKFDISSITGLTNIEITDASLFMTGNTDVDNGPLDVSFYDIGTSWMESSVTFNSAPTFSTQLSSSITTFNIDSGDADNDGDFAELIHGGADVTEFIKDKFDLGTNTIAIGLKSETLTGSPQFKFSSKEDAVNFASRPYIVISYIDTSSTLSNNNLEDNLPIIDVKYTNPIEKELQIRSNSIITSVDIYSITGKLLITKKINNTSSNINATNLTSGTYILVVKSNNQITSKLLIKN